MKKAIDPANSCLGKTKYEKRELASSALKKLNNRSGKPMRSYKCLFCDGYHIGHENKRQKSFNNREEKVEQLVVGVSRERLKSGFCLVKNLS